MKPLESDMLSNTAGIHRARRLASVMSWRDIGSGKVSTRQTDMLSGQAYRFIPDLYSEFGDPKLFTFTGLKTIDPGAAPMRFGSK